ncbi:MAG: prolyl oligopeptidase family serine peptidase, partial [Candidatus Krumholzibacteria bacterium]|nr:prolyl oligopeptidase family serine peptidase [Candidatus Krumholzibacteria bacterium]
RDARLYLAEARAGGDPVEGEPIDLDGHVASFEFGPDGSTVALAVCPRNLIDHIYMFQKIHILDLDARTVRRLTDNPGKLGNFAFSPDGKQLAYAAALTREDHAVSQAFVIDVAGGGARNLTPDGFAGHVQRVGWEKNGRVLYLAAEGVWNTISSVGSTGGDRRLILHSRDAGIVFDGPGCSKDRSRFALIGSSPGIPGDVFYWKKGSGLPRRLTTLNPWIADRELGRQEVVRYAARDGLEIEGILVWPVGHEEGKLYPLIVTVHGGPEAHYSNTWMGGYFNPGQVLAGKGYFAFYPNYRASTGYGVGFAMQGYMDAAGKEFDDVADGIDWLVSRALVDPDRVGLGGGSYGGYAAAWFSSYYTEKVRAVCMFVGISDLVSKRGTTDIPYEELYVHSGKKLDADDAQWEFSLRRSPIYWAHRSRTAVLILGGAADTRVHPSQSLEYYRRLKMNDHPAVRPVQYPGEGHGNRKQPGRIDVLYRHLQWYDWYVRDRSPLEGPMPPLMIHEAYGLDLPGNGAE